MIGGNTKGSFLECHASLKIRFGTGLKCKWLHAEHLTIITACTVQIQSLKKAVWLKCYVSSPWSGNSSTAEWGKGDIGPVTALFFPSSYTLHHHPAKWCPSSAPWLQKPSLCSSALRASPGERSGRAWRMDICRVFWISTVKYRSSGFVSSAVGSWF